MALMATDNTVTMLADLLLQYHLTVAEVARAALCREDDVQLAMDIERFDACPIVVLVQVRVVVEKLLHAGGWRGDGSELWREFDERLGALLTAYRSHRSSG
ncbi:MAG: hypothetical protein KGJ56_00790 [Gammaproteobacteria bacterium]|nr:hypothetical protein [Gammaproteobacteria bacterium]